MTDFNDMPIAAKVAAARRMNVPDNKIQVPCEYCGKNLSLPDAISSTHYFNHTDIVNCVVGEHYACSLEHAIIVTTECMIHHTHRRKDMDTIENISEISQLDKRRT